MDGQPDSSGAGAHSGGEDRPTVAHVITGLGPGGAQRVLAQMVAERPAAEAPERHVVVSLMDEGLWGGEIRAAGVPVHTLGMRRGTPSPAALLRLAGLLRRTRPATVMSWLYHADLYATLAAPLAGIPARRLVWNLRCSDMDFARYSRATALTVRLLARLSHRPGLITVNSRSGQIRHGELGYRPQAWRYVANGFNLETWRPDAADRTAVRAELGLSADDLALGVIARVDPMKDHAGFLAACAILAGEGLPVRPVLIGEGTPSLVPPAPLAGRVLALGERRDVPRLVRGLDLLVMGSAYGEGFPNVVGEAMASGVPCAVTDVGDAAELVGGTGAVAPPGDAAALADAVRGLLTEDGESRRRRGEAARRRIESHYRLDQMMDNFREIWRNPQMPG